MISQIDDLYARHLKNSFLMNVLKNSKIEIHSNDDDKREARESNTNVAYSIFYYVMVAFYRALKIAYSSFYFYFAPYTVVVLSLSTLQYAEKPATG